MTDYTKTTDFTSKDSLPSGDSGKIIRGAEFGTEFDNIETAVNSKSNIDNPIFTGTITGNGSGITNVAAASIDLTVSSDTDADYNVPFMNATGDGGSAKVLQVDDNGLMFNPNSNTLRVNRLKGSNDNLLIQDTSGNTILDIDANALEIPVNTTITGTTAVTGNITVTGTVDGRDVAADGTKLDTVETNADVTDTTNVTDAGALMDSEVTNLAQVKAFDSADYATAAQGTTADAALPKTGGAMTGAITTNSTFDGRDVATDGTKLDTVETNADVTDTVNVTAAGAVMDSELTDIAAVKALNQGVATTDSPTFAGATVNGTVEFDGLSGTGAVTVTDILDQDDMSGNSATALATQQSIKSYVDSQVATSDTLAEVLANGNATGGTDVVFGDNDKAVFGAGDDLKLYHTGSHSYIDESGTGNLYIGSNNGAGVYIQGSGETLASFLDDGAVTLHHDSLAKLATSSTGIDVTGVITTDGMTTSADINFGDNDKAVFGAGSDLQIYHDGVSRIKELGAGGLYVDVSNDMYIRRNDTSAVMAEFNAGVAKLMFNGSEKLATTSTGIDVTGSVTADGLTVDGLAIIGVGGSTNQATELRLNGTSNAGNGAYLRGQRDDSNAFLIGDTAGALGSGTGLINYVYGSNPWIVYTNGNERLTVEGNGDISFYEDTGTTASFEYLAASTALKLTGREASRSSGAYAFEVDNSAQSSNMSTAGAFNVKGYYGNSLTVNGLGDVSFYDDSDNAKFFWDASAESLGIGTSSPSSYDSNADNLVVGGESAVGLTLASSDTTGRGSIYFADGTSGNQKYRGTINYFHSSDDLTITTAATERMRIDSAGQVGIGTSSPVSELDVAGTTPTLTIKDTQDKSWTSSDTTLGELAFRTSDTSGIGAHNVAFVRAANEVTSSTTPSGALSFGVSASNTNASEAMRIDSTGNLLVSGTSTAPWGNATGTAADNQFIAREDGIIGATAYKSTTNLGYVGYFNRTATDGGILAFNKNGATVGSIGTAGSRVYISGPSASLHSGLLFTDNGSEGIIAPSTNAGAIANGTTDLGYGGGRFKDLYLSGGAYLGGTASANKLDDYEEGTFTPVIIGSTTAGTGTYTAQSGHYTKIGNTVTAHVLLQWNAHTGTGNLQLTGFPVNPAGTHYIVPFTAAVALSSGYTAEAFVNSSGIFSLYQVNSAGSSISVPMDTSAQIAFTVTYRTA